MTEITLKPLSSDLLPVVEPWFDDPETRLWLGSRDWPRTSFQLAQDPPEEFRGRNVLGRFAFVAFKDGEPVGLVDWEVYDDGDAGIAVVVDPAMRSRGVGRSILLAALSSPEMTTASRVTGGIEPENVASVRCFEAAGFFADSTEPDEEGIVYFSREVPRGDSALLDFDFHLPDEVRVFSVKAEGILRNDKDACVYAARYGDVRLVHYAFSDHWFKINVTVDDSGTPIASSESGGFPFALNCDVSTPMTSNIPGSRVFAVDLFADVLVGSDGTSHVVGDLDQFGDAKSSGLIDEDVTGYAARGLEHVLSLTKGGSLLDFVNQIWLLRETPDVPSAQKASLLPTSSFPLRWHLATVQDGP